MHWLGEGKGGGCVDELVAVELRFVNISFDFAAFFIFAYPKNLNP